MRRHNGNIRQTLGKWDMHTNVKDEGDETTNNGYIFVVYLLFCFLNKYACVCAFLEGGICGKSKK